MERTEEGRDLIETLWNVKNFLFVGATDPSLGFNRDIVECKGFSVICSTVVSSRFNRDIVECKEAE